jgi:hypothetical protein
MAPPATYDELQAEIGRRFPGLSRQLQRIARFALERPQDVRARHRRRRRRKVEVQPSAWCASRRRWLRRLLRHAAHLPRRGWCERSVSYRERIAPCGAWRPRLAPKRGAARLRRRLDRHLSHLEEHVGPSGAERACDCSRAAGASTCSPAPRVPGRLLPLAMRWRQLELPVALLDGVGGHGARTARAACARGRAGRRELPQLLARVIELAATPSARRRVVVITDSAVSPLARSATVAFDLGDPSDRPFRSLSLSVSSPSRARTYVKRLSGTEWSTIAGYRLRLLVHLNGMKSTSVSRAASVVPTSPHSLI